MNGIPFLRGLSNGSALYGTGLVHQDALPAPLSPELGFKGLFQAALPLAVRPFVAGGVGLTVINSAVFLCRLIILRTQQAHVAQDVRRQGTVFPVGTGYGHSGLNPLELIFPLTENPHRLRGNILSNYVRIGPGIAGTGHIVTNRRHNAGILAGIT